MIKLTRIMNDFLARAQMNFNMRLGFWGQNHILISKHLFCLWSVSHSLVEDTGNFCFVTKSLDLHYSCFSSVVDILLSLFPWRLCIFLNEPSQSFICYETLNGFSLHFLCIMAYSTCGDLPTSDKAIHF